jgi:bifunctional UDP-N-acetylglucosamine pyrophosphorylase/glucosamine-1-phosphate N-acetyltransferase
LKVAEEMTILKNDVDAVANELEMLSGHIDPSSDEVAIILAAGHGKRIKSEKSKMLHEIWGKPSVWRVCKAARMGLSSKNQVIVVGKKALEVARALGKEQNRVFVYQKEQRGTGDAVRMALQHREFLRFNGNVFIFPGDMGLLSEHTVRELKDKFQQNRCDMLVITGFYEGHIDENYYGRILKSKNHPDRIIEIKEHRDILAMKGKKTYSISYRDKTEHFSPEEMLEIREFNVGVYAIGVKQLRKYIGDIETDNVQGEIYITDLIKIFNDHDLRVVSSRVANNDLVLSFNVKSVLMKMDATYRNLMYERLKDIITIDDPEDFFVAEETVNRIVEMDKAHGALDIHIGKGVWIGKNVKLGRGTVIQKNAILKGNVTLEENVTIGENVNASTYPDQTIVIGKGSHIFMGNVLKGNVQFGKNVRVETGVRITGSSEDPVKIGNNVLIKGMTYIYGSIIEDDLLIEHSILKNRYVEKVLKKDGKIQPIKYILPHPEGLDSIYFLNDNSKVEKKLTGTEEELE